MNLTESIAPKSDQLNADDLMTGPRTVTIVEVRSGSAEQPVNVVTEEFGPGRPYKPSKSMRRVMVSAWGADGSKHVGHQLTLFRNPTIRFGKDEVGGIQISHMSHIDGPLKVSLTVTRGKRAPFTVQPLTPPRPPKDESGRDWLKELAETECDADLISGLGTAARAANAGDVILNVILTAYREAKNPTLA
ncbi:hypothetical protein [Glaciibacter psychrotolerans]|uniref:Uncharacterized protein n=1 Tax=Glaciibacter psychrotolerans TaxID=670054 RepID=A0A7Z0ECM8_9MICO|nr:hypothetical protein [Leifsonia psychrotolerans]NYJ19164.1 hypothetical protein [Leifsonia psychrotolerans]